MTLTRVTDRGRLDAALLSVVDQLPFAQCCTTCTTSDLQPGTYAYYHAQDIETAFAFPGQSEPVGEALDGAPLSAYEDAVDLVGPLYIGFGIKDADDAMPRDEDEYDAVGRKIVGALEAAGFMTDWAGSADQRIRVVGIRTYEERTFA